MNYYPGRDRPVAELDQQRLTSSELVQRTLAGARVVKAFNNIDWIRLACSPRPPGAADRCALPIASDDADAARAVSELLDALGYDAVSAGPLAQSWRSEPGTPVYVNPYLPPRPAGSEGASTAAEWFTAPVGTPVGAGQVAELLRSAQRQRPADARERLS